MNKNIIPALKMIYPYDNTAQDKGNYIPDDVKVIPPNGGKVVAASKGAFYADTLVIRKGQETLQLNRDYELAGFYQQATEETGKPVNVLVVFKRPYRWRSKNVLPSGRGYLHRCMGNRTRLY